MKEAIMLYNIKYIKENNTFSHRSLISCSVKYLNANSFSIHTLKSLLESLRLTVAASISFFHSKHRKLKNL